MNLIQNIIFKGKIPYLKQIKFLITLATLGAVSIFFIPKEYKEFGEFGWALLIFVIFIRPIADLLPRLGILKTLTLLRKEIGVMSGVFILAHGFGYLLKTGMPLHSFFTDPFFWDLTTLYGWGTVGLFTAIILLLTSNKTAIKTLKKYWKPIQRLSYLFFLSGAIHIILIDPNEAIGTILLVIAFFVLNILSAKKITLLN